MATRNSRLGINAEATGTARAVQQLNSLDRALRKLPNRIDIAVELKGIEKAVAEAKLLDKALKGLPNRKTIDIVVNEKGKSLAALAAELKALPNRTKTTVDVDTDRGARNIRKLKDDSEGLGRVFTGFLSTFSGMGSGILGFGSEAIGVFSSVTSSSEEAAGGISAVTGDIGKMGAAAGIAGTVLTTLLQTLGAAFLAILKFGALATALTVAGAAIAEAWGAASTAIAAVPAALSLILVPMAAVKLGMDGIQKAAKKIEPQFKSLQKAVSDAFERGLTPVLKNLADNLFPHLKVGLSGTADSLSLIAKRLTDFVTGEVGLKLLSDTIGNVNRALTLMAPSLEAILQGFLRLASSKAAMDALLLTVQGIGEFLNSIASNKALETAFTGLGEVIHSLETAFTGLVNNGITLFANSYPGLKHVIDAIREFFTKFDYKTLGKAVSDVFDGIAETIKKIPQGTIDGIVAGFKNLGATFKDPSFQDGLVKFTNAIPAALGLINLLVKAFGALPDVVIAAGHALAGALKIIPGIGPALGAAVETAVTALDAQLSAKVPPAVADGMAGAGPAAQQSLDGSLPPAVRDGVAGAAPAAQQGAAAIGQGLQVGLQPMPGFVNQAFIAIGPQINAAFQGLAVYVSFGMQTLANAVTQGFTTSMVPAFTTGFATTIGPTIGTAFLTTIGPAVRKGMADLGPVVSLAFTTLIGPAFTAGFAALGPAIGIGFLTVIGPTFKKGMADLAAVITLAFTTSIAPAFTQGFASIQTSITAVMAQMAAAVRTGMDQVGAAVKGGMELAAAIVVQTGTQMVASITTTMDAFVRAVQAGLDKFGFAIKNGMALAVAVINSFVGQFEKAGEALGQGLVDGINAKTKDVEAAAARLGAAAAKAVNSASGLNAASPSKKSFKSGVWLAQGLINGMDSQVRLVEASAARLGRMATTAAQAQLGALGLATTQPVIRFSGVGAEGALTQGGDVVPVWKFYIGDREVTDLVRAELEQERKATAQGLRMRKPGG